MFKSRPTILLLILMARVCSAQSWIGSLDLTNSTPTDLNIDFSLSVTNNVFVAGSDTQVSFRLLNRSTNIITLIDQVREKSIGIFLLSPAGKIIRLTPAAKPTDAIWRNITIVVSPGNDFRGIIPVKIPNGIPVGKYNMLATRIAILPPYTSKDDKWTELVSKWLAVEVKRK